jgi:hypothetical protein
MQPERLVLCGGARRPDEQVLRLATTGQSKNIMLRLEDIGKRLIKPIPGRWSICLKSPATFIAPIK